MAKNIMIFADGTGQIGGIKPDQRLSNVSERRTRYRDRMRRLILTHWCIFMDPSTIETTPPEKGSR